MLMLTTYIGFEFEGAALAEIFQTLEQEEQNEIRLMVQDLIFDYYDDLIEEEGFDRREQPEETDDEKDDDEEGKGLNLA